MTSIFMLLLILKLAGAIKISWFYVFLPLTLSVFLIISFIFIGAFTGIKITFNEEDQD